MAISRYYSYIVSLSRVRIENDENQERFVLIAYQTYQFDSYEKIENVFSFQNDDFASHNVSFERGEGRIRPQ